MMTAQQSGDDMKSMQHPHEDLPEKVMAGTASSSTKPTRQSKEKESVRDERERKLQTEQKRAEEEEQQEEEEEEDGEEEKAAKGSVDETKATEEDDDKKATKKSRRELPPHTVAILKGWMLSPEHVKHPYPTDEDKQMLLKKTGINMKQLTNWFTNARKRIWKPMMRREHSRQLQSAMEFEKSRPRDQFNIVPGASPPYGEGYFSSRGRHTQSFDAGSLGAPREQLQYEHYPRFDPRDSHQYNMPANTYHSRPSRSLSESPAGTNVDDYIDAMRIRKRVYDRVDGAVDADPHSEKRFRWSTPMSPRSLKILQDWVSAHSEYPFPSETEKAQLVHETGLDMQQIDLWFKSSRERMGAANYAIQNGAHGVSPNRGSMPLRSIPARDNPQFPPPPTYGERRSIPSNGNPLFPPRPTAAMRSSIPSAGNPQFPPPPAARRQTSEGFYGNTPYSGQYAPPPYSSDLTRPMRSLSTSSGPQHTFPPPRSPPKNPTVVVGTGGLPSLSSRNLLTRPTSGPTMGQPRDGRSHTLDVGLLTDARRRKMNFQDILASTSARPAIPSIETTSRHNSISNSENMYPNGSSTTAYPENSFDRQKVVAVCSRCGANGPCGCGVTHVSEDQPQRSLV